MPLSLTSTPKITHKAIAAVTSVTLLLAGSAPVVQAQTSATETFEEGTTDIFDNSGENGFNPLDLIHQANFSREDPFSFFQRQQENLSTEASDFRQRQLEQLRQQGYQPPAASVVPSTEEEEIIETSAEDPDVLLELPAETDDSTAP